MNEIIHKSHSPLLIVKSKIIGAKISSQSHKHEDAATAMMESLPLLANLNSRELISEDELIHLRLPVLWRMGMQRIMLGDVKLGIRSMDEHYEISAASPYQRANAEMCRAILCSSSRGDVTHDKAEEALMNASNTLLTAPDDGTNFFAFRDKSLLGIICLESLLDFKAGKKFQSYIKIHVVRHFMQAWNVSPQSEGFAEQINPALPQFKQFFELLTVPEIEYENWLNRQADSTWLLEARMEAAEVIAKIDSKGRVGYSADDFSVQEFKGERVFLSVSNLPDVEQMKAEQEEAILKNRQITRIINAFKLALDEGKGLVLQERSERKSLMKYTVDYVKQANLWIDKSQQILRSKFAPEHRYCRDFDVATETSELRNSIVPAVSSFEKISERYSKIMLKETSDKTGKSTVFVVHGHDDVARRSAELLLLRVGCEPLIFDRLQKRGSQTVIELLEDTLRRADAVVVLLTPDDEGRKRGSEDELVPRARQNVLIEAGYAVIEKREKSIIVAIGGVEIPSDIEGILRVQKPVWNQELEKDLAERLHDMELSVNLRAV